MNKLNTTPLQIETGLLESAISLLEKSVGIVHADGSKRVTPESVWEICKQLFFSVPTSQSAASLSEKEKDAQLAQHFGMSKTKFLERTKIRLLATRRHAAKFKKGGR